MKNAFVLIEVVMLAVLAGCAPAVVLQPATTTAPAFGAGDGKVSEAMKRAGETKLFDVPLKPMTASQSAARMN